MHNPVLRQTKCDFIESHLQLNRLKPRHCGRIQNPTLWSYRQIRNIHLSYACWARDPLRLCHSAETRWRCKLKGFPVQGYARISERNRNQDNAVKRPAQRRQEQKVSAIPHPLQLETRWGKPCCGCPTSQSLWVSNFSVATSNSSAELMQLGHYGQRRWQ